MLKLLYKTLNVNEDASPSEIKKAYRAKARETHPDLNNDSDKAFKKVALAYSILSDNTKRKEYDETGYYDTCSKDGKISQVRAELVRLFMETISSECNLNYTDIFEVMADKIEHNKRITEMNIQKIKEKITKQRNVINRIESKNGLFVSVLQQNIQDGEKIISSENAKLKLIPLLLNTLKEYKYRVDEKKSFGDSNSDYTLIYTS